MSPPRMTTAISGASRAALRTAPSRPDAVRRDTSRVFAGIVAIAPTSSRESDPRIDEGVEDVHEEIDPDDHEPRHDDDALHQGKVALEDAFVEQAADARPREDDLDDDGGVDHHDHVDAGQGEDRNEGVLEGVHGDDDEVGQALEP